MVGNINIFKSFEFFEKHPSTTESVIYNIPSYEIDNSETECKLKAQQYYWTKEKIFDNEVIKTTTSDQDAPFHIKYDKKIFFSILALISSYAVYHFFVRPLFIEGRTVSPLSIWNGSIMGMLKKISLPIGLTCYVFSKTPTNSTKFYKIILSKQQKLLENKRDEADNYLCPLSNAQLSKTDISSTYSFR